MISHGKMQIPASSTDSPAITASSEVPYCSPLAEEGSTRVSGSFLSIFHFQCPVQIHDFTFFHSAVIHRPCLGCLTLLIALLASSDSLCSGVQAQVIHGPAQQNGHSSWRFHTLLFTRNTAKSLIIWEKEQPLLG